MKKLVIALILIFTSFIAKSQVYTYRTTDFAYKEQYKSWTEWQKSNLKLTINFNTDAVIIYSEKVQVYKITQYVKEYYDVSGGQTVEFRFIDQDRDRGTMRLRIDPYGTSQIYIDFSNISWVYNIVAY